MKLGRVSGTVVSTISHPIFDGRQLLMCDLLGASGRTLVTICSVSTPSVQVRERRCSSSTKAMAPTGGRRTRRSHQGSDRGDRGSVGGGQSRGGGRGAVR